MKPFNRIVSALTLAALAATAAAGPAHQDHAALRQLAQRFLETQTTGLPGQASVTVGGIDARLNLPACPAPEAFLPSGGKAWGRTSVGLRCNAPTPWKIFVTAQVRVEGEYLATASPLVQGHILQAADFVLIKGDLTAMPAGIVTDPAQVIGLIVLRPLAASAPLRQDMLRGQQVVKQGQSVRVESAGKGFRVSTEGKALSNATAGQAAQARTANGQVVSGIARLGGVIEVVH
jgi:flagella basal body P-ring formation protein FlgA